MRPHQEEPGLWDVAQAPHHHFNYITKTPKDGQIFESTYFFPSGAWSLLRSWILSAAKTISAGAM